MLSRLADCLQMVRSRMTVGVLDLKASFRGMKMHLAVDFCLELWSFLA